MTIKGRVWWVKLWLDIKNISVYDVLNSVGEELWISDCTKWLMCENSENCSTTDLFWNLQKSFNWILKLQTLDKIIKEKKN
jgi:DNA-binding IscR family transcriptional regulator